MKFAALLIMAFALGLTVQTDPSRASIYDSNVIEVLKLTGTQKQEMQKVLAKSRSQRNRVFQKYGIDPNAKPEQSLLQRASSELIAIGTRERADAARILNSGQLRRYDELMKEMRQRIMRAF